MSLAKKSLAGPTLYDNKLVNPLIRMNIYKAILVCVPFDGDQVALERILGIQHTTEENFERLVKRKLKYLCVQVFAES